MTRTILLADDSITIQKIVELAFVQNGYEVHTVGSGDEAIARLEGLEPDVVIADVHMPGASGYDVCRAAKERYPQVPVVLLIGAFESFDPADVSSSGAEVSVKKPFDSKQLFATVESLVSEREPAPAAAPALEPEPSEEGVPSPVESAASEAPIGGSASVPVPEPESTDTAAGDGELSEEDVDRIARRVVELLGEGGVREVAWEVIPDLAEIVIKDRIRELESQVE